MRVRSTWGWVALLTWPVAAWAQGPGVVPPPTPNAGAAEAEVNVGSAKLPDLVDPATREPKPEPEPPPAPATRLLGPNDNPYRGPSVPGADSYENPYRGPSLKPPYENPYRGPSAPAETLPPGAVAGRPAHWGPPDYCPPGSPCQPAPPGQDRTSGSVRELGGATQGSPFINAVSGAFLFRDRVSSPLAFGGELGAFLASRLRLSGRALVPIASPNDEMPDQDQRASRSVWLWGFGAGVVVSESQSFTLAPGLQYLHLAGGRHGDTFGVQVPFEWLLDGGLRLGFDFSVMYGLGGKYLDRDSDCRIGLGGGDTCAAETRTRPRAPGVALNLVLGQAFSSSAANR